ncbi:MAG: hypothetical protein ACXVBW_10940, partial [Bdellovibrionota bacterium]
AQCYFLSIGRETKRIAVEDTAYFVQRVDGDAVHGYELLLNDESREKLDAKTLTYRPARLTCRIKSGSEEAKFLSAPYMDLLNGLEEDASGYFLKISGSKIHLAGK